MTPNTNDSIHPMTKVYAGFDPETPDSEVREYIEDVFPTEVEKPCGILLWCPYGPLVEDFPLHPKAEAYAIENGKYVRWDPTPHGQRPDGTQYPGSWVKCGPDEKDALPDLDYADGRIEEPHSCAIFGHDCPAFHVAEPFADPQAVLSLRPAESCCSSSTEEGGAT